MMEESKTNLFITRHGETLWNTQKRFQGFKDSPLTENGINRAKRLNQVVKNNDIEVIVSSPLKRAHDTAMYAKGDLDIPVVEMDEFREMNLGQWEGRTLEELEKEDGDNYKKYWNTPFEYETRNGENFQDLLDRINIGLIKVIEQFEGKRVLLVTHGMTLMAILSILTKRDLNEIIKEPVRAQTGITHIEIGVLKNKLILDNDTSHFEEK